MDTTDLLAVDAVLPALAVTDKADLLRALAGFAAERVGLPEREVLDALKAREQLGSTALSKGLALPHARIEGVPPFIVMARLARAIDYEAKDDEPVDLAFLVLWPAEAPEGFLPALSALCGTLRDPRVPRRLRSADSVEAVMNILRDAAREAA